MTFYESFPSLYIKILTVRLDWDDIAFVREELGMWPMIPFFEWFATKRNAGESNGWSNQVQE